MDSWKQWLPNYQWRRWDETTFDIDSTPYTREAYDAGAYAFVSDYVRLWALEREGGIYLDIDVEMLQSLDNLLSLKAFAGFEGSKHLPLGTCILASEAHGDWVTEMLEIYQGRHFLRPDGSPNLTTNVQLITEHMVAHGLKCDGSEQDYRDLHIFPVDYFSPRHTTGEYLRTENSYCNHLGLATWEKVSKGWKDRLLSVVGPHLRIRLIKLKRKLLG